MPRPLTAMRLAALCAIGAVALYVVAVGTADGRSVDGAGLLSRDGTEALPAVRATTNELVRTIDRGSLVIGGVAVLLIALTRRRPRLAATAGLVIAGANLTTQFLKPYLERSDPVGGDALRVFGGTFPSGHATVAMSLALALVIVMPPLTRGAVALLGGAYAACVGVGLVVLGWHYPSDVAGGYLVAAGWAAFAVALIDPGRDRPEAEAAMSDRQVLASILGAAILLGALIGIAAVAAEPNLLAYGRLRTTFFVGSALLAAMAIAIPAAAAALVRPKRY